MKNFFPNCKVVHMAPDGTAPTTFALGAGQTSVNSSSVDRKGYESVAILAIFGDNADTGTFAGKVQHSSNNTDFTDAKDADGNTITFSFTAGASNTDHSLSGIEVTGTKLKQYVRLAIARGTANTAVPALLGVLSKPSSAPVAQTASTGQFIAAPTVKVVNS